jgi:hypothetical protein
LLPNQDNFFITQLMWDIFLALVNHNR